MFVHAEKLIDDKTNLRDGDVSVFLRLGSDSKSNYYEYEVPLSLTEPGNYSTYNAQDQEAFGHNPICLISSFFVYRFGTGTECKEAVWIIRR